MRRVWWSVGLAAMAIASGSLSAQTPPATPVSESTITLDGGAFHQETVVLPRVKGDWFATASDAHATISLLAAVGGHPVELALQWDGLASSHVINADNNSDMGGRSTCDLIMTGAPPYSGRGQPHGADIVTITVSAIDALTLKATINGTVTGDTKISIKGTISIHRAAAPPPVMTSGSGDCDRVVHDKLVGAQNRSPSDCEVRFDRFVREAQHKAFAGVIASLTQDHWVVKSETPIEPASGVGRHTENSPFSSNGYGLVLALDQASPVYAAYAKQWQELSDKVSAEITASGKTDGPAFVAFTKLNADGQAAMNIRVSVAVNPASGNFVSFAGGHAVLPIPGAAYAVSAPRVQAASGGGAESASEVAFIYLGRWQPAVFDKRSDGSESAVIKSVLNPAATPLSVQTLVIKIECNAALRDALLEHIDLPALLAPLPR
jgi:hypothetical protein